MCMNTRRWRRLPRCKTALPNKKTPVLTRLHQTLRQQLVIRTHDGRGTDSLLLGTLAHRRQAGPRCQ